MRWRVLGALAAGYRESPADSLLSGNLARSAKGVTILLIEEYAKHAPEISDYGLILEQGQTRVANTAETVLADPRIGELFLGGGLKSAA